MEAIGTTNSSSLFYNLNKLFIELTVSPINRHTCESGYVRVGVSKESVRFCCKDDTYFRRLSDSSRSSPVFKVLTPRGPFNETKVKPKHKPSTTVWGSTHTDCTLASPPLSEICLNTTSRREIFIVMSNNNNNNKITLVIRRRILYFM